MGQAYSLSPRFSMSVQTDCCKFCVKAAALEQLLVVAQLGNGAVAHDNNQIGIANSRQAVRDDKAGSPLGELCDCVFDSHLGARVYVAGRLVKNKHGRQPEHDARDAQQLLLTGTEPAAVVPNHCVIAFGQPANKALGMCCSRGCAVFPRRSRWGCHRLCFPLSCRVRATCLAGPYRTRAEAIRA